MTRPTRGIHHVTAIAGDAQRNLDFYSGVLGLRLVKRTVNFDDPGTYHLYFGDEQGRPGTIMTFFPWAGAPRGSRGVGQTGATAFSVPEGSLDFWQQRLDSVGIPAAAPTTRFDEEVLTFQDPDGLRLELVADEEAAALAPWQEGPVADRYAIRSFHGVTLLERSATATADLLTEQLGFVADKAAGNRQRFRAAEGGAASRVDLLELPNAGFGQIAVGSVHHVAFRSPDEPTQLEWRQEAISAGLQVTGVRDRNYFRSLYFREPGGVLFEIATDSPGFVVDEEVAELGQGLKLPDWLEERREVLERKLPELVSPTTEPVTP